MITILLFSILFSFQNVDSIGTNDNPVLSRDEAIFFNDKFKSQRGDFDFNGKKIAFLGGPSGQTIYKKNIYFKEFINQPKYFYHVKVLTKKEHLKSCGYDALILAPAKIFTKKHRANIY